MFLYILLIICLASLLFTVENFENTFIHVPKTSGSSVVEFLKNYDFKILGHEHFLKDDVAVLVIREPIDRFQSSYNYWKHYCIEDKKCDESVTVSHFIEYIKTNNSILYTTHTWDVHYLPQSNYMATENYKKAIVIRYDKDKMESKLNSLLEYLNIENKNIKLTHNNKSTTYTINIQQDDLLWLMQYYKDDFDLWNKLNTSTDLFLKVF